MNELTSKYIWHTCCGKKKSQDGKNNPIEKRNDAYYTYMFTYTLKHKNGYF